MQSHQLADPPLWSYVLFESPWAAVGVMLMAGVVTAVLAKRTASRRLIYTSTVILALAALVALTAKLITTTRETLIDKTTAMITATAPLDPAALHTFFDPAAVLVGPEGQTWFNIDHAIDTLKTLTAHRPIEGQYFTRTIQAQLVDPTLGYTLMRIRTGLTTDVGLRYVATTWLLTWQLDHNQQWRIINVQWLEIENQKPTQRAWNR